MYEYALFIFLFSLGAIIGSFLNVCIYRIPHLKTQDTGETQNPLKSKLLTLISNLSLPPSHCPSCSKPIAFYDNIPIISYIILKGRCRECSAKISLQYPVIELTSGVFSLLLFKRFGWSVEYPLYFAFLSALLVITVIDLKYRIIPDEISLSFIPLGLLSSPFLGAITFVDSLLGVALGGGGLFLLAYLYYYIRGIEGMGGGDIKLLSMIGAFLGWEGVMLTLFLASFFGAVTGLPLALLKGKDMKYAIPFGPFLSLGALVYLFWGRGIIDWYMG